MDPAPSTSSRALRLAGLSLLFFVSGAAGLVYQVAWTRRLELTFGSTTHSIGTVLAAYMAGLGLGAWLLGRLADRPGSPARRYALLEAGIGACGLLAPFALDLIDAAYVALGGAGGFVTKALLGLLALLPPTLLMGGTLPVLVRGLVEARGDAQRATGLLYGMNTLGAVAGATAAGLWVVPWLGTDVTSWATGAVNLGVAAAALALGRRLAPDVVAAPPAASPAPGALEGAGVDVTLRRAALATTFGCGAVALALEVAWSRAFGLALGSTGHGFTIVLAGTLFGIGAGSLLVARRSRDPHRPLLGLAVALLLLAGACYVFLMAYEPLLRGVFTMSQRREGGYEAFLATCFLICAGLLLPATLALGVAFPLAVELGSPRVEGSGRSLGALYLANTCGAVLGSVLGGFVLIPLLGTEGVLRAGMALAALGGVALVALAARRGAWLPPRSTVFGALGAVLLVAAAATPGWDPMLLDCGPTRPRTRAALEPGEVEEQLRRASTALLYAREGVNCYVTVRACGADRALLIGGKPDASSIGDMPTQLMVSAAPFLARPDARRVLVVGVGSAVSARCVADFPGVEQVDVVEIEAAVVEAARACFGAVNHGVLDRPGVRVLLDDARTVLLTTPPGRYDLIVGEPTNPWIAGVANLFTLEHYQNAKRALRPGGTYVQWIQLYMTDRWMLEAMVSTFLAVFPHAEAWIGASTDILLVGSEAPLVHDLAAARAAVLGNRGLSQDLWRRLGARAPEELYGRYLLDHAQLRELFGTGEVLHDRLPRLEGRAARAAFGLADSTPLILQLWERALARPSPWPALTGPPPQLDLRLATARHLARDAMTHALARRVLAGAPGVEAAVLRAEVAASPTDALREVQAALVDHPADPRLRIMLAWLHRNTDRKRVAALLEGCPEPPEPDSRLHLLRALSTDPATPARAERLVDEVERGLAACELRDEHLGERRLLLTELPRAARATPRAAALLERLLAADDSDADVALTLARACLEAGDVARCLDLLDALETRLGMRTTFGVLWLRAHALLAAGDPAAAGVVDEVFRLHPVKAGKDAQLRALRELVR